MKKRLNSNRNKDCHGAAGGFTLVELLLVLTVVAVSLLVAAPLFTSVVEEMRLHSSSRQLLGAISYARHEAIMRGRSVTLCPSPMWHSGEAVCAGTYTGGWIVFANANRDSTVDEPDDEVLRVFEALPEGYQVLNRAGTAAVQGRINYLPDGSAHRNLTLQLCPPDQSRVRSLSIVLNIVGRARLDRNWGQCRGAV